MEIRVHRRLRHKPMKHVTTGPRCDRKEQQVSGAIAHIEIPGGAEIRRARAFWSGLFGWQFDEIPVPSAGYLLTRINDDQGAAISNTGPTNGASARTSRSMTS